MNLNLEIACQNDNGEKLHQVHIVQRILNMDISLDAWPYYASIILKIIDYKCGENNAGIIGWLKA